MADDAPAEPTYTSKQVHERLGISGGMLRRYAMALEEVVGKKINLHPRDGRQYTGAQVAVLERAKQEVTKRRGLAVETAIRLVLGKEVPDTALLPPAALVPPGSDPEAVRTALEPFLTEVQALRRGDERLLEVNERALEVSEQVLEELRALRAEVEALRAERTAETPQLPEAPTPAAGSQTEKVTAAATEPGGGGGTTDGLAVRFARWLEGLVRRKI